MRILYVTTVGSTMSFFTNLIRVLLDEGHTVDIACNERIKPLPPCYRDWGCKIYPIDCVRNPFSLANRRAVHQIRSLADSNRYDIVHCHTPVAGVCARLACRKMRRSGLRVFYTAHGLHFYKGAPLKNWLLYYPAEKICAHMTDTLIVINREDYSLAQRKLHAGRVVYVPGVGIDVEKFHGTVVDRSAKRAELGIPEDAFVLISVGELNANKNHQVIIRAVAQLHDPTVHYLIAGMGPKKAELEALAESLGISGQIHLAGYRNDVAELYKTADVDVFPSIREGLGLASIEGMAAGLPLICSDNRGTREYTDICRKDGFCGICTSVEEYVAAIRCLQTDRAIYAQLCQEGYHAAKRFSVVEVNRKMMKLYENG